MTSLPASGLASSAVMSTLATGFSLGKHNAFLPAGLVAFGKQFGATSLFADDETNEVFGIMKKGAAAAGGARKSTSSAKSCCPSVLAKCANACRLPHRSEHLILHVARAQRPGSCTCGASTRCGRSCSGTGTCAAARRCSSRTARACAHSCRRCVPWVCCCPPVGALGSVPEHLQLPARKSSERVLLLSATIQHGMHRASASATLQACNACCAACVP